MSKRNIHDMFGIVIVFLFLLSGCVSDPETRANVGPTYFPHPPAQPRYLHEITLRGPKDLLPDDKAGDQLQKDLFGRQEIPDEPFIKPVKVAAGQGKVFVTDTMSRTVTVFDIARRRLFRFGYRREGQLKKPMGVAVDGAGDVYVVDLQAKRVISFDRFGLYKRDIGDSSLFVRPTGVAVSPLDGQIYVSDTGGINEENGHQVLQFSPEGRLIRRIGRRGQEEGAFYLPTDLAVAPDGTLHVLDGGNFRVQSFDGNGKFLRTFGMVGRGLGQFARPRALAVDGDGLLYVSDSAFSNIQVFTPEGRLLLPVGERDLDGGAGKYVHPSGLAVDETNRLYILDQILKKVEVLRKLTDEEGKAVLAGPQ